MFLMLRSLRLTALLGFSFLITNAALAADKAIVVEDGKEVSFFYKLTVENEVVDANEGREPMMYIQGGGQILPALEKELEGMKVNDKKTINLDAANAYGPVDPAAIQEVPTEQIPEGAREVGAVLQAEGYPGPIRVVEVKDDITVVDFNHPLAGKSLTFDVTIVDIATPAPAPTATAAPANNGLPANAADGAAKKAD